MLYVRKNRLNRQKSIQPRESLVWTKGVSTVKAGSTNYEQYLHKPCLSLYAMTKTRK